MLKGQWFSRLWFRNLSFIDFQILKPTILTFWIFEKYFREIRFENNKNKWLVNFSSNFLPTLCSSDLSTEICWDLIANKSGKTIVRLLKMCFLVAAREPSASTRECKNPLFCDTEQVLLMSLGLVVLGQTWPLAHLCLTELLNQPQSTASAVTSVHSVSGWHSLYLDFFFF